MRAAFLVVVFFLALSGCACQSPSEFVPVTPVAAAPAAPCAPALAAPQMYAMAAPVGVESRVGANEVIRSGLSIPPNILACGTTFLAKTAIAASEGLVCLGQNLWPNPTPTTRYVYAQPAPQYIMLQPVAAPVAAPAAAPCVPMLPAPVAAPPPMAAPCR